MQTDVRRPAMLVPSRSLWGGGGAAGQVLLPDAIPNRERACHASKARSGFGTSGLPSPPSSSSPHLTPLPVFRMQEKKKKKKKSKASLPPAITYLAQSVFADCERTSFFFLFWEFTAAVAFCWFTASLSSLAWKNLCHRVYMTWKYLCMVPGRSMCSPPSNFFSLFLNFLLTAQTHANLLMTTPR